MVEFGYRKMLCELDRNVTVNSEEVASVLFGLAGISQLFHFCFRDVIFCVTQQLHKHTHTHTHTHMITQTHTHSTRTTTHRVISIHPNYYYFVDLVHMKEKGHFVRYLNIVLWVF